MSYKGKYSLKSNLLAEMDRMDFYQDAKRQEAEFKSEVQGKRKVETWEDLEFAVGLLAGKDELEDRAQIADAMGRLAKNLISASNPLIGAIWGVFGALKDVYELATGLRKTPENKAETNPAMDSLKLDPTYSEMLDPKLEGKMIKDFYKELQGMELSGTIPGREDSFNKYAEKWIRDEVGENEATIQGATDKFSFQDIEIPDADPKQMEAVTTFLKELF